MPDMIHVTLQYSNAVLVALLPIFSDFAKKLELPVPAPITCDSVDQFAPRRLPGDVGGTLRLTNGWRFDYSRGHVDAFEAPKNYFTEQNPDRVHEYLGEVNMSRGEALVMARQALKRMGYAEKLPYTTKRPSKIEGPLKWRGHTIPWYRIEWEWKTGDAEHAVWFNIDGQRRQIARFFVASTNLWGKPPEISVKPELESEYRKRVMEGKQIHGRDPPPERLQAP
jgi:hypothetical protein